MRAHAVREGALPSVTPSPEISGSGAPCRLQEAQARFLDLLTASRETRTREDKFNENDGELYRLLEQLGRAGGTELDISHTGVAYLHVSPELWQALGQVCGMRAPPVDHLALPRGLHMLPEFVAQFPSLGKLTIAQFRGCSLNLTAYPQLTLVDLGTISHEARALIRVPLDCNVKPPQQSDGKPALLKEVRKGDHKLVVVEAHPLDLNGHANFSDGGAINCLPLSRQMLRAWRQCHMLGLDIHTWPMAYFQSAEAIARNVDGKLNYWSSTYAKEGTPIVESKWKDFVAHQFDKMAATGQEFAYAVLNTGIHAVPLCFEIFRNQNGSSQRLLRFCETNAITEVRTVGQDASLRELWGNRQDLFEIAFHNQEGGEALVSIYWSPDPLDDSWGRVDDLGERSPVEENWVGSCEHWHPLFVRKLVLETWHPLLQQLPNAIAAAGSTERCKSLLLAQGVNDDRPLVHLAAGRNESAALATIVDAVVVGWERGLLNEDDVLQILEARSGHGISALEAAMLAGNSGYVHRFLDALLWLKQRGILTSIGKLAVPSRQVLAVTEGEAREALIEGTTALWRTLYSDHGAAARDDATALATIADAVVVGWKNGLLDKDDVLKILEARSVDGKSALEAALLAGSATYVHSFLDILTWLHRNGVLSLSEVGKLAAPSNEVLAAANDHARDTYVVRIRFFWSSL